MFYIWSSNKITGTNRNDLHPLFFTIRSSIVDFPEFVRHVAHFYLTSSNLTDTEYQLLIILMVQVRDNSIILEVFASITIKNSPCYRFLGVVYRCLFFLIFRGQRYEDFFNPANLFGTNLKKIYFQRKTRLLEAIPNPLQDPPSRRENPSEEHYSSSGCSPSCR